MPHGKVWSRMPAPKARLPFIDFVDVKLCGVCVWQGN